ncbi:hypothetical protein [Streptomyces sp. NPDC101455]|uniref:hypothetical protein n=1 Tax=Streptomyces sp. NPDC101455 TaxID=3366142 RepID=UPI00381E5F6D
MSADRRSRLVPVACVTVHGEPDGAHLALMRWMDIPQDWVTGSALCGRSAEQGALPEGTHITCRGFEGSCESYRDSYQRALEGRPTAQEELVNGLRAGLDRLGGDLDVYRKEVLALRDELERVAYDRTWPLDRTLPADVRREVERAQAAGEQQIQAITAQFRAACGRWDSERQRLTTELEAQDTARRATPILRRCLYPGCAAEFDMNATACGREPARPSLSGKGWVHVRQLGGYMCPAHVGVVGNAAVGPHLPKWKHGENSSPSVFRCHCGWDSPPARWRGFGVEAWKDHLLTVAESTPDRQS